MQRGDRAARAASVAQRTRCRRVGGIALAALASFGGGLAARAQPARTIEDGVYSVAQARRGEAAYRAHCAGCHRLDMAGDGQRTPSLSGDAFLLHWNGKTLAALFNYVRSSMPQTAPRSLAAETYADLVAYLLAANAFPAGARELGADDASLDAVRVVLPAVDR